MERGLHLDPLAATSLAPARPEPEIMSRRVLIVEDNEFARCELQRLLQDDPRLHVDAAAEGEEALQLLAGDDYSLVLTDLRLPGLDGIEFLKEVQRRNLPVTVIVITGDGSIDEAVQALHLGAYDFLTKPIDLDHLRVVVRQPCANGNCATS